MVLLVVYKETTDDAYKYTPSVQRRQYINKVLFYKKFLHCTNKMKKEAYNKSQKYEQCIWF